jgi:hypothetical protein
MQLDIKNLFIFKGQKFSHFWPAHVDILSGIWWRFMPGVIINVRWPVGKIVVGYGDTRWYDCGATWVEVESADPNDFYRPFLEQYVGKQGWHWNWGFINNDVAENRLSIKIIKSKAYYASLLALKWA